MSRRLTKVNGIDLQKVFQELYDSSILGIHNISQINSTFSRDITKSGVIHYKGEKLKSGAYKSIHVLKKHNYRDYYYPFIFNEKDDLWNISSKNKGKLMIQKINNTNLITLGPKIILQDSQHSWKTRFSFFNQIFVKSEETGAMIFYDIKSKELIYPHANLAINLK